MAKRDYKSYNILDEDILEIEEEPISVKCKNEIVESDIISEIIEIEHLDDIVVDNKLVDSLNKKKRFILFNKFKRKNKNVDKKKKSNQRGKQKEKIDDIERKNIELDNAHEEKQLHFPEYKKYYEQKERSALFRWLMLFAKIMITLMLLPLIGFIAVAALCCIGAFLLVIMICIGTGLVMIGGATFMATQISTSVLTLGICVGITLIALGGIIFIIFLSIINWLRGLLKKYKKPRIKMGNKEEVR